MSAACAEAKNLEANAILTELRPLGTTQEAVELADLQQEIRETVALGAVAIVQNAVERAKEAGQYQLIKFLFEIAGLYPVGPKESESKELSLARMLCRELGVPENPGLDVQAGDAAEKEERGADGHAVK
jgi:hypothetical protein